MNKDLLFKPTYPITKLCNGCYSGRVIQKGRYGKHSAYDGTSDN
jgi:hypothetical protein